MKLPRGFAKNYFSLNAITATTNAVSLHQVAVRVQKNHLIGLFYAKEEALQEEEEPEVGCFMQSLSDKACHCNCFFLKMAKKSLLLFAHAKYDTFFTAVHYYMDSSPPFNTKLI
jgi:hypothetical protein